MGLTTEKPTGSGTTLDPQSLVEDAYRQTGGTPDQSLSYLDGLTALCAALDTQARLTPSGRVRVRGALVKALVNQRRVRMAIAANPQIERIPVVRPVFVTGLLRTGTTFLQHLLAQHPQLRAPQLWELMAPADPEEPADLIAACESYIAEYYRVAPKFKTIHPLGARLPEECHRLTANTFRDLIYAVRYRVPDYLVWLRHQSMVPAYEFHLTQLRCVLFRQAGSRLLLKGPSHLWHLEALATVYPDARIIRLHRSPIEAVSSVCSLTSVVRGARSDEVDNEEIGWYWLDQIGTVLDDLRPGVGPTQLPPLDVRYADFIADPLGTAGRVCDFLGVPLTDEASRRMSAFIAHDPGTAAVPHRYTPQEFGLRPEQLEERFASYIAAFDL
jgi:Sulfotransferase family